MAKQRSTHAQPTGPLTSRLDFPRKLGRKSADYVAKNYKFFHKDPNFFWMKTVARFELARNWATRPSLRYSYHAATSSSVLSSERSASEIVETLRKEGYCTGLSLSAETLSSLLTHCQESTCFANRDPNTPFKITERHAVESRLGRPIQLASYFNQQEEWPAFRLLRQDPLIQSVAAAYLGCEPVYIRSELCWSFPYQATDSDRRAAAQVLHCDINDFRTLKFFFYLSDVGIENGPHAYIKKNPRQRTALHQLLGQRCASLPESELMRTYAKQLVTVCGPAGSGFAGDPYYFHRGTTPLEGERLLLQMEFARRQYRTWYFDV